MKVNKILKMAKQLEISQEELVHDLAAIDLLSDNFKNMLSTVLLTAGISIEKNLESFDDKKDEMLKLFKDEDIVNSIKHKSIIEDDFIGFIYCFLDYPVIEK